MSELTEAEKRNLLRQRRLAKAKNGADRLNKITGLNQSYKEPESSKVLEEVVTPSTGVTTSLESVVTSVPTTITGSKASTPPTPTTALASSLSQLIDDPDMMDISSFAHEHAFKQQPQDPTESQEEINYRNDMFAYVEHNTKRIDAQFFVLRFISYLILLSLPNLVFKNWILLMHLIFQLVSVFVVASMQDYKATSLLDGILPLANQFLPPVWASRLSLGSKVFSTLDLTLTDFSIIVVILGLKNFL